MSNRYAPTPDMPEWNDEPGRIDPDASRAATARIGAVSKECWRNSVLAGYALDADGIHGLTYHEGLALIRVGGPDGASFPIEHGWLETAEGRVLDATLPIVSSNAELRATRYLTALRWPIEAITGYVLSARASITLPLSGTGGAGLIAGEAAERVRATWTHALEVLREA